MQEILTVTEAAKFLNKHPDTIRRWILSKRLRARKIPAGAEGVYVLLKTDLLEYAISAEAKQQHRKSTHPLPSAQRPLPLY